MLKTHRSLAERAIAHACNADHRTVERRQLAEGLWPSPQPPVVVGVVDGELSAWVKVSGVHA